jgi:type I site-specific restriction endonuclease
LELQNTGRDPGRRSTNATRLDIPFVFSSNGDSFVFHDRTRQQFRGKQRQHAN